MTARWRRAADRDSVTTGASVFALFGCGIIVSPFCNIVVFFEHLLADARATCGLKVAFLASHNRHFGLQNIKRLDPGEIMTGRAFVVMIFRLMIELE